MIRRDYRCAPVRRLVVMGESNAYGMCAGDPLNEWVQTLAFLIRRFQEGPLRVFNNAIPSNVISPRAPGYDPQAVYGIAPSALERFEQDMIAYQPDMAVYAYGLNDSRCGHAVESFIEDYETIVRETRRRLPEALIVLVGPYWNLQYDAATWAKPEYKELRESPWGVGGDELVLAYNAAIAELADRYEALFSNVYRATEGATWLLHDDTCHFTDVGQWLIGQTVFATLAANCSFVGQKSINDFRQAGFQVPTTGGTNALPHVIGSWRTIGTWQE